MSQQFVVDENAADYARINRAIDRLCTFLLAAAAGLALTASAYLEALRTTRIGVIFALLFTLHLLWRRRLIWSREFGLYACLVGYMLFVLLWTHDVVLAMNTLVPAIDSLLVMVFFGSLISFHDKTTTLAGTLCGFSLGAALYTLTSGFPFSYPAEFSYNAIAGMYLFGLFATLMYSCFRRSHFVSFAIAVVVMLHIVATTSIKTNLGIALGLLAAGIMYFAHLGRILRRRVWTLIFLAFGLALAVASNDALVERLAGGAQRVFIGINVLEARDDVGGYSAFELRDHWRHVGIEGWKLNPVFGYGTEAFRDDFGITSHSTPIDLLYNFGLIGLILFYGVFASLIWRLLRIHTRHVSSQRALILAGVVCYVFVSLSGTLHYDVLLAAFFGISVALLRSHGRATASAPASSSQGIVPR